jgi:hypothetical protein
MLNHKKIIYTASLVLIGLFILTYTVPGFSSDKAGGEDECYICGVRGVPFPDEEINRYIGRIIDTSLISEIDCMVEEKYPGHYTSFTFEILDAETEWNYLGDDTWQIHFKKVRLINYLDHGIIDDNGEVLAPPVSETKDVKVLPLAGP